MVVVRRILLDIQIYKLQRNSAFQCNSGGFNQRVCRFDQKIYSSGRFSFTLYLVPEHRYLRQTPDTTDKLFFNGIGELYGDTIRSNTVKGFSYEVSELHTVMEGWKGVNRAELFKMEKV
jgi:hypothetical protein